METTAADYAKIQAGTNAYLELSNDAPDKAEEFLNSLRQKLGWSPEEIVRLQMRVVEILLGHGKKESSLAMTHASQ